VAGSSGVNSLLQSKINSTANLHLNSAGGPTGEQSKL